MKKPIKSNDPQAIEKLQRQLDDLAKAQKTMVAANKIVKKVLSVSYLTVADAIDACKAAVPELVKVGVPSKTALSLFEPDYMGRTGFRAYELTNNSANIRRIEKRIEQLKKQSEMPGSSETINGVEIVVNKDDNRVQLVFPGKPSLETRTDLKHRGFKWSPSRGVWQRQISDHAIALAKNIAKNYYS